MAKREPKINGVAYDKNQMFWAVMYKPAGERSKPYISEMYPRAKEARVLVNRQNREWKGLFNREPFSVKRFMFYFKGAEIDAYEHEWSRLEKVSKKK